MAKKLFPITVNAPGAFGLNKKNERLDIGAQWCTEAVNTIIDKSGVLGTRKGWEPAHDTAITGNPNPRVIHEYIDSVDTSRIITAAGNKLYEGTAVLTDITGTLTPTGDNWKFVNFNNKVIGVQAGHNPIVKSGTGNFAEINFNGGSITSPYEALSGWGRVWYVDQDGKTIHWSDLLIEGAVTGSTSPGSAGSLNLATVWGGDTIIALAAFNDYLVIFGKEHIVLYDGPEDPNNSLSLAEVVYGTGCIARDSVQNTGNDIVFLSYEGLNSLTRNVQSGSLPLVNMSENVRDYLATFSMDEPEDNIKSTYKPDEGYYLLSLPNNDQVFYFSFKYKTPEGLPRITNWVGIKPTALCSARNGTLYLGKPGYLAVHGTYRDNTEPYTMTVKTGWDSGEGEMGILNKIPKNALVTVKGGYSGLVTFEWGYDYNLSYDSTQQAIDYGATPAEFNIAQFGIDEYAGLSSVNTLNYRMSGTGRSLQLVFTYEVDGSELLLQRADVFLKLGRVI